jgi:hypothetical protein
VDLAQQSKWNSGVNRLIDAKGENENTAGLSSTNAVGATLQWGVVYEIVVLADFGGGRNCAD